MIERRKNRNEGEGFMSENKVNWHPYPQERPIEDNDYLITVKYRHTRKVMKWDSVNGYFYIEGNVTAWAELPEPYKEQKNDQSRTN